VNKRWRFDNYFYTFTEPIEGPGDFSLQVLMIDTILLTGLTSTLGQPDQKGLIGVELTGPSNQESADAQLQWIKDTLQASTATHLLVAGHYPVYSICEHGPTPWLIDNLLPLLEGHGVSFYVSGHDHCAEHIKPTKASSGGGQVNHHGIGNAGYADNDTSNSDTVPYDYSMEFHDGTSVGGFARFSIDGSTGDTTVYHYNGAGEVTYKAEAVKMRASVGQSAAPTPAKDDEDNKYEERGSAFLPILGCMSLAGLVFLSAHVYNVKRRNGGVLDTSLLFGGILGGGIITIRGTPFGFKRLNGGSHEDGEMLSDINH
jgi:hypothetical protein